jgi:hypothetical protein
MKPLRQVVPWVNILVLITGFLMISLSYFSQNNKFVVFRFIQNKSERPKKLTDVPHTLTLGVIS